MVFQKNRLCLCVLTLILLLIPCACTRGRVAPELPARVYSQPYDDVWEAVTWVILDEMGCVERKAKKNKGYFETEWVHSLDTEGHHRWMIEAHLKEGKDGVTVTLDKIVQLKDDESKTRRKYSKTAEKTKEPVGPHAGWSNTASSARETEDLYNKIDLRLGE